MKSKPQREERQKAWEAAQALLNAVPSGETMKPEDSAKFDEIMAKVDALKVEIDRIDHAEAVERELGERVARRAGRENISKEEAEQRDREEGDAFMAYIRHGMNGMTAEQRAIAAKVFKSPQNAQGTSPDTAGGYTVPTGFYTRLIDAELAYGGMLGAGLCNIFDTDTGNSLPIPTDNDTSNKGAILGENVQVSPQDATFGAVTMGAYTYSSKLVLVANQLLQDSAFKLDDWLSTKLGVRIGRIINDHFTTGTGASQPTGVVTAATLGQTGASGETTSLIFDDLVELEHSVDPAYRTNAKFMMADTTLKVIKKLKDGQGRPLWLPGFALKEPDTINGYGYVINQSMAVPAANAKSMLFGDFQNYFIRRVAGVQVLRLTERYADYNQTGFLAFQRWDGQLVDAGTHPIKYFQHAAS